jgi:hypothetical protein
MAPHSERAEFLNRLCELREAYAGRGPDDRDGSITIESLLGELAHGKHFEVASEPIV